MPFAIILFILLLPFIIMLSHTVDSRRIDSYIRSMGGTLLDKTWTPFGPGWFGEKDSRIYSIHYLDREGNTHEASCKTGWLSGVYLTEDSIIQHGEHIQEKKSREAQLEEENRRLREELERLRLK